MLGTTFGGNHLACVAALGVLEVMESEHLMHNAAMVGDYLVTELKKLPKINEVRGKGLMIGIDLPEELNMVKKNLLFKHKIFTGEAKPNVIRLLPALNISKTEADIFLHAIKMELNQV
jgi:acetylornithine aminotransferase